MGSGAALARSAALSRLPERQELPGPRPSSCPSSLSSPSCLSWPSCPSASPPGAEVAALAAEVKAAEVAEAEVAGKAAEVAGKAAEVAAAGVAGVAAAAAEKEVERASGDRPRMRAEPAMTVHRAAQDRRRVAGFRAEGVRWARSVVWWEATIPEARGQHRRRRPKGSAWRVPRLWTCSRHSTQERMPLDHR